MNIITNIKKSYKHIPYSFKHYIMVMKLEKKYIGYYKYPFHDLDKIFMYIFFPFLGTKVIQKYIQDLQNIICVNIKNICILTRRFSIGNLQDLRNLINPWMHGKHIRSCLLILVMIYCLYLKNLT